jgi:hypothetical protein
LELEITKLDGLMASDITGINRMAAAHSIPHVDET